MSQTPEQRREALVSEAIAGLWARWYESGANDLSRGWARPYGGVYGPYAIHIILTRADVRDLAHDIEVEHGKS